MEQLKTMKQCLMAQVQSQMGDLRNVDTEELGEAIDMIKDLSEAIYYCTVTEAMDQKYNQPEGGNTYYYTEHKYIDPYYRDMDRDMGRMYYSSSGSNSGSNGSMSTGGNNGGSRNYNEREWNPQMRDSREGRSPMSRKNYMESKQMHTDKARQMKDLEQYIQELTSDITEMIEDATPEEKQLLQKKISVLATKIV